MAIADVSYLGTCATLLESLLDQPACQADPNPNPDTLGPPDRDAKLAGGKQRTVGAHGAVRAIAVLIG